MQSRKPEKDGYFAVNDAIVPLVSIIIRSMDRSTLNEALASVAAQAYAKVEVVVVNAKGGVHRNLGDCCGRFPLRVVNQGGMPLLRPQAANAGLDAARGDCLAFLDDDDALDADHLSGLVAALQAHDGGAVVYAGVRCVDRGDSERKISRIFGAPLESAAQLLAGNFIPIHAPLFPRHLLEFARFDESLQTYEDWDFWLQLAQHAKFVYTEQVSATYFTGGTSGVSPQAPDWEAVRLAMRALYAKWMRLTPDEFRNICNLYHQAAAQLQQSREEAVQIRLQRESAERQLQAVYSSSSWAITRPLRWLKTVVRQLLSRV